MSLMDVKLGGFGLRWLWCWPVCMLSVAALVGVALCVALGLPGPAAASECPNEALRLESASAGLPDCRAYEMVTPSYKAGYPMFAVSYARSGEQAILYGLADIAGIDGSCEIALAAELYLDTRTPTGWQISPLNPPASQFVGQVPLAEEANDGETLWAQHTPTQPADERGLYVSSADGVFSFIGPLSLPERMEANRATSSTRWNQTQIRQWPQPRTTTMCCYLQASPGIIGHWTTTTGNRARCTNTAARETANRRW